MRIQLLVCAVAASFARAQVTFTAIGPGAPASSSRAPTAPSPSAVVASSAPLSASPSSATAPGPISSAPGAPSPSTQPSLSPSPSPLPSTRTVNSVSQPTQTAGVQPPAIVPKQPLPLTPHNGPVAARFGASAVLLRDQAMILFFGGFGGQSGKFVFPGPDSGVVALNVRSGFAANSTNNWIAAQPPSAINSPPNTTNLVTTNAYGVGIAARGIDIGLRYPGHVLHWTFAQQGSFDQRVPGNEPTPTVYQYMPGVDSNIQGFWSSRGSPGGGRQHAMSCLLDPKTVLIHGGTDQTYGVIGDSTFLVDLSLVTSAQTAWTLLPNADMDGTLMLTDGMMACYGGNAVMLGGMMGILNGPDNNALAGMSYYWKFSYTSSPSDGSWTRYSIDGSNGYPQNRTLGTLTAVDATRFILHGGRVSDQNGYNGFSTNDLWLLDLTQPNAAKWQQLPPAPQQRHSHNAILVGNHIIYAFGTYENSSFWLEGTFVPSLIAYNLKTNSWGDFDGSSAIQPVATPSAMEAHLGPSPSPPPQSGVVLPISAIYGIAGGAAGVVVLAIVAVFVTRHNRKKREQAELDVYVADRVRREENDEQLALQGILGASNVAPDGRVVGGELKKVILHKQTGVERGASMDDSVTEEDNGAYKFGMKVLINDAPASEVPQKLDGKKTFGNRDSYASGFSGLTYPSGSGISLGESSDDEDDEDEGPDSEIGSAVSGSRSSTPLNSKGNTPSVISEARKRRKQLLEKVSKRGSSTVPKDQPLRPWELPGMGVINSDLSAGRSSQAGIRSPSRALTPSRELTARNRSYTPPEALTQLAVNAKQSRFSLNSSLHSGESSSALGMMGAAGQPQQGFDEGVYMRTLFAQFSDQQILESWNSYVSYTGQVYTLEQISALRVIYGSAGAANPSSEGGSSSNDMNPGVFP